MGMTRVRPFKGSLGCPGLRRQRTSLSPAGTCPPRSTGAPGIPAEHRTSGLRREEVPVIFGIRGTFCVTGTGLLHSSREPKMRTPPHTELQHLLAEREWLVRLARRLLGNQPDAEDLAQATLVKALESPAPRGISRGWLATVARNLFYERRRAEAGRKARERWSSREEAVDESEALERAALQRVIIERVLELPELERSAVVLRFLEGLSYAEVAGRQGISIPAVRKRVSRAVERLRTQLDEAQGGRQAWAGILLPMVGFKHVTPAAASAAITHPFSLAGFLAMSTGLKSVCLVLILALLAFFASWDSGGMQAPVSPLNPEPSTALSSGDLPLEHAEIASAERTPVLDPLVVSEPTLPEPVLAFPLRPEADMGALELHVRHADGTPARGVSARVHPWGSNDFFLHARIARTDEKGVARIDQLAPGSAGVNLAHCGGGSAQVVAGTTTIHEVQIPAGLTLRGRVLDPDGRPVAGAILCLSAHGNPGHGHPVGTSAADGRFEIRDVSDQRHLSARAPGFAPSDQIYAKGAEGSEITIDLSLRGAGATLAGIVLAPDGAPLVGARVRITGTAPMGWKAPKGTLRRTDAPLPFELRTDSQGRFRADQVGAGRLRVQVRAERWGPWEQSVQVAAGATTKLEARLEVGCTLEGSVRHADGTLAAGAHVTHGPYGAFDSYRSLCASDGTYILHGLPAGSVDLKAVERGRGKLEKTLMLHRDTVTRWDATLLEGNSAAGLVVDERGEPLANWQVGVTNGRGLWLKQARTDAQGRFELLDLEANTRDLAVADPFWFETGPCLWLRDALPSAEPLRIEVPDNVRPSSTASLRLWVDGKPAPADTQVGIGSVQGFSTRELYPDQSGRVTLQRLRPGAYEVTVSAQGRAKRRLTFSVQPEENLDLGDIHLALGGRVRLLLKPFAEQQYIRASVVDPQGIWLDPIQIFESTGESPLLTPGPTRLLIGGGPIAFKSVECHITDGETLELEVPLAQGAPRWVRVTSADHSPFSSSTRLSVYDNAGELVQRLDRYYSLTSGKTETRVPVGGLEIGSYRIVVESDEGRRGEAQITVSDLEVQEGDAATIAIK